MTDIELPDGEYTAVVDNVEDGLATVFFERDGEEVGNAVLDASRLPSDGRHADAILSVRLSGGRIESASYKPEQTESRKEAAQNRFDRLSKRPPSDEERKTRFSDESAFGYVFVDDGDEPSGLADLTAFQRDLLWALSRENARKGLALKTDVADYYGEEINHSRLYQILDALVERDLVAKAAPDRRTNECGLSEAARRELEARRAWEAGGEA